MNPILWEPDKKKIRQSAMWQFMQQQGFDDYDAAWRWSDRKSVV